MKDTLDNKRLFFALYFGQIVLAQEGKRTTHNYPYVWEMGIDFLELKSLDDITDEHAYEIGKLINCWSKSERKQSWFEDDDMKDIHVMAGQSFAKSIGKEWGKGLSHPFANSTTDILSAYDTLRQKGYALPYGKLTVEEQLKYNWIKLKRDE